MPIRYARSIEPPESGAGYHRHPTYDETFIICEGRYDFRLGEKLLKLVPGDVIFVPRGTPHGFVSTGPEVGRQIIISSPGGVFDAMIAEVTMLDLGSPTRQASEEPDAPENMLIEKPVPLRLTKQPGSMDGPFRVCRDTRLRLPGGLAC